jgi:hypothetical protein
VLALIPVVATTGRRRWGWRTAVAAGTTAAVVLSGIAAALWIRST